MRDLLWPDCEITEYWCKLVQIKNKHVGNGNKERLKKKYRFEKCKHIIGQFIITLLHNDQLESICLYLVSIFLLFSFSCTGFKKVRVKKNYVILSLAFFFVFVPLYFKFGGGMIDQAPPPLPTSWAKPWKNQDYSSFFV